MSKLAAPFVSRSSGSRGRSITSSPFNEGISVPPADWAREAAKDPALNSKDRKERSEAITKSILNGALSKYRRR